MITFKNSLSEETEIEAMKPFNDINTLCALLDKEWEKSHRFTNLFKFIKILQYYRKCPKLELIGSGSSRTVYNFNDEYALKLAKNKKGLAQNEVEGDWGLQNYSVAAKLIKDSKYNIYLVSELCKKAKKSDFPKKEHIKFEDFCACIRYMEYEIGKIRYEPSKPEIYDEYTEREDYEYSLLSSIRDYIADFDVPSGDLVRITNYGINKEGDIVLTDTGLNNDVDKTYYR